MIYPDRGFDNPRQKFRKHGGAGNFSLLLRAFFLALAFPTRFGRAYNLPVVMSKNIWKYNTQFYKVMQKMYVKTSNDLLDK